MIVFKVIRYRNFLSSGNIFTEINLCSHKNTLITGQNGSGKTTLLDAITFSLFGKPFRKVNKGNVVNSINRKECVVEIEFRIGKKEYLVRRGIKPNIFEIFCDGSLLNQEASIKDYQEYFEKNILKINFKSFTQIVILGASSFTPFMQLTPNDRRVVIEDLLDLQIFSAMSIVAKNKAQAGRESLSKNRFLLNSKEENRSYIEKTLKSLRQNSEDRLADLIEKANDLEGKKTSLLKVKDDHVLGIDDLLTKVTTHNILKKKHTTLISLQSKLQTNRQRLHSENAFYDENDQCPTCQQPIKEDFKLGKKDDNNFKLVEIEGGLDTIDIQLSACISNIAEIDKILTKINDLKLEVSKTNVSIQNIENGLSDIKAQIDKVSVSDKVTQESEDQLETINQEISDLQKVKEAILEEQRYEDLAVTLLKDGGIKTKIIKQYLPVINKSINKYLAKMGFFADYNINESFEETIKSRYRDEFSYNNFSEGEKLRIDLAILLTWRYVSKLKNSMDVNLLIFDEILDSSLDQDGIDIFLQLMWGLDKDTNIFVISHRGGLEDKFSRSLEFRKEKNFSTVQEKL